MSVTPAGTPTITVTLGQLEGIGTDKLQFEKAEDKKLFLDLVNKAYADKAGNEIRLEIPRPRNAGELGLVPGDRDRYDSILSCAQDVLLVLRRLGADMEKSNREAKHAAREGEHKLMLKSADKIREAAVVEMVAGIVGGALQIAGGALSAHGSMKAMKVGLEPYQAPRFEPAVPSASTPTPGAPQIGNHRSMPQVPAGGMPPLPATPTGGPAIGGHRALQVPAAGDAASSARPRSNAVVDDGAAPQQSRDAKLQATRDRADKIFDRRVQQANMESQGIQGKWNAVLQIFMGASSTANSIIGVGAKELEAQKAEIDADTKKMGYKVDDAKESQDTFHQLKEEMQRMLSEISQSEYQMNKQIWS